MGSLTVGLSGCSEEPTEEYRVYQSVEECVKEDVFSQEECRDMAVAAVRQNPQFGDLAECEKTFGEGNCQKYEDKTQATGESRSSWMPLLAGYMVGRYLGGGSMMQGAQPVYPQQGAGQPGASAGRSFRTLGGGMVQADAGGRVAAPSEAVRNGFTKSAKPYAARSGSGTRGGFSGGKATS
jgi:uncharacterized protein YgiB involved in biofilm formation